MINQSVWKNSNVFLITIIGAVLGLTSLTQFSFLVYENGGGAFFIPYIIAIVLIGVPFLILEFGVGVKFNSSLSKFLFNIKHEFEYLGWFILFVIFLLLAIYICVMGWDLIYIILSLFKGWGANPKVFFNDTLLHSGYNLYSLTYIIVPIAIAILFIWSLIYFVSKKGINGITKFNLVFVPLIVALFVAIFVLVLSLNGAKWGMALIISPNWNCILNYHVWIAAFTQVLFVLLIGQGVSSSFASYFDVDYDGKLRLVDNAWIVALVSFIFQILFSLIVFGLLGALITSNPSIIKSLSGGGFNLVFIILPMVFNTMGILGNIIAFSLYFLLFICGITSAIGIVEPFVSSIVEKFNFSRSKALRYICIVGIFSSLVFTTGMGQYLIGVVSEFLMKFVVLLAILLELVVIAWVYGADRLVDVINDRTSIKVDAFWIFFIKYISPIILITLIIFGVYELILSGDSRTLFIDSITSVIFIFAPLILTLNIINNDFFDLDLDLDLHTWGSNKYGKKTAEFSTDGSFVNPYKYKKDKRNGKNVISNVDLSSSAFDSPHESTLDDFCKVEEKSANTRGKSVFGKLNMFNNAKGDYEDFAKLGADESDYGDERHSEEFKYDDSHHEKSEFNNLNSEIENCSGNSNQNDTNSDNYSAGFNNLNSEIENCSGNSNQNDMNSDNYGAGFNNDLNIDRCESENDKFEDSGDCEFDELSDDFIEEKVPKNSLFSIFKGKSLFSRSKKEDYSEGYEYSNLDENDIINESKKSKFRKSFDFNENYDKNHLEQDKIKFSKESDGSEDKNYVGNSKKNKSKLAKVRSLNKNKSEEDESNSNKSTFKCEEQNVEEYQDFTEDFFDDGVFGDEGYESLLDDYVEPKKHKSVSEVKKSKSSFRKRDNGYDYESNVGEDYLKSKSDEDNSYESDDGEEYDVSKPKIKTMVNKSKNKPKTITISADKFDENKKYDFENKGSESVFNLDD